MDNEGIAGGDAFKISSGEAGHRNCQLSIVHCQLKKKEDLDNVQWTMYNGQ